MIPSFRSLMWMSLTTLVLVSMYNSMSLPDALTFHRLHLSSVHDEGVTAVASTDERSSSTIADGQREPDLLSDGSEREDDSDEYRPYVPIPQTDQVKKTSNPVIMVSKINYTEDEEKDDSKPVPFSCTPKFPHNAKARIPLIVFTMEHAGSSRLFQVLHKASAISSPIILETTPTERVGRIDLLDMDQLFTSNAVEHVDHLWEAATALAKNCFDPDLVHLQDDLKSHWISKKVLAKPQETIDFLSEKLGRSSPRLFQLVQALHHKRRMDMIGAIRYLQYLPSCFAEEGVVAIQITDAHLRRGGNENDPANIDPAAFVDALNRELEGRVRFVILWRKNLLRAFVAKEKRRLILLTKNHQKPETFSSASNSTDLTTLSKSKKSVVVVIDRDRLERFIRQKQDYFKALYSQFRNANIPFQILEYEQDISLSSSTPDKILQQIQHIMHWKTLSFSASSSSKFAVDEQVSHRSFNVATQRLEQKPSGAKPQPELVRNQISNWEEVTSWGYKGDDEKAWPDLVSDNSLTPRATAPGATTPVAP